MNKLLFAFSFLLCLQLHAQDSSRADKLLALPDKLVGALDRKTAETGQKLQRQTDRYLDKLQKQETKLKRKLLKKDSLLAESLFGDVEERYAALKATGGDMTSAASVYSPRMDSLTTALRFLQSQNAAADHPQMQATLARYEELQQQFNATELIKSQLQQRQHLLKEQFAKLGMVKELKKFRSQVYYYQAQLREYKEMWEDPAKMEAKLMELVARIPAFRDFFARNSTLGSLFAVPGSGGSATVSLAGLQTRASVNQLLVDRFGTGGAVTQALQQNVQSAQAQLGELKNKLSSLSSGSYGNGDADMPEFRPNGQKTKSFLQRLEYGANVQSQKARYFFPVTSDIGLSLGYKINDKSVIGVGASYKLGLGRGWDQIAITHQGIGLRSYVDWKIKGGFFVSGGYEQNYRSLIRSVDQLRNYSSWQSSGLVGLTKKYSLKGKMKGEMKLLWDFLSQRQVPRAQAIVFRIGYSLK